MPQQESSRSPELESSLVVHDVAVPTAVPVVAINQRGKA